MTTPRRTLPTALIVLAMVLAVVVPAPSAHALPNSCIGELTGVGDDYAAGRRNGHPTDEPGNLDGWNGRPALRQLKDASFIVSRVSEGLLTTADLLNRGVDGVPQKVIQLVITGTKIAVDISLQAIDTAALVLEQQNERVDACRGTLVGDLADVIFVTMLEEDLAYADLDGSTSPQGESSPAGVRLVPSAMFVLPQDGWPAWQQHASLYTDAPGHTSVGERFVHGALNGDYIGVAVTVRNQIAYMDAAGIDVGSTTTEPDPHGGPDIEVKGAKDLWMDAMAALGTGDEREAHRLFALAYQRAVTAQPPPGATSGTTGAPGGQASPAPSGSSPSPSTTETPSPEPAPSSTAFPTASPSPSPTPTPTDPPSSPWG